MQSDPNLFEQLGTIYIFKKVHIICYLFCIDYISILDALIYHVQAVPEKVFCVSDYLDLKKLDVEEIVWVDEINGLLNATSDIEACKIIGMDCEWRPNFEKNTKSSKVTPWFVLV